MVHLFMLVSVLFDRERLTNSIYMCCKLNIRLETSFYVDDVAIGE